MATLRAILDTGNFKRGASVIRRSLDDIKKSVSTTDSVFAKFTRRIGRIGDSFGVNVSVAAGFSELVDAAVKIQKYETTMTSFTGSLASAREELQYVLGFANKMGVSFEGIATPFSKFAAAAEGFKRQEIHTIFEAFVTAASGLQLNMQEVNGVFLALQQIVSKGKLSMEELRLQLAERIPGAMTLAARAAKMSMLDFEAAVRAGTINTREWMVEFAELVESKFKSAADVARFRLQAAIMRLGNAFLVFKAQVVDSAGASENLVSIFNAISQKFLQNETVTKAFGDAIGFVTAEIAGFVNSFDDEKIGTFAEKIQMITEHATKAMGGALSKLFDMLADEAAWDSVSKLTIAVIDLGAALVGILGQVDKLPGDIVEKGIAGYALFGKWGPLKFFAMAETAKSIMEHFFPDVRKTHKDSKSFIGMIIEAMFGPKGDLEKQTKDFAPMIVMEPEIEVDPTVKVNEQFQADLAAELEKKQALVDEAVKGFTESSKFTAGIEDNFGEMAKSATQAWKDIKDVSLDSADDMLQQQTAAANAVANVYKEALGTRGLSAVKEFSSALASAGDALDSGALTDDMMVSLSDGLRKAAEVGVKAFTKMGRDVNKVLSDISKKEKELADEIRGYANDIDSVHRDAGNMRFDIAQRNRTEAQQYQAIVKRTNALFREANTLAAQAKYQTGEEKKRNLERSNELMEKGLDLSQTLESTEKNGVSAAKLRKDQLTYINIYEKNSVKNLKTMKTDAEDQLKVWQEVKKEFEAIDKALKDMVTAFTKGMKIDLNSGDAIQQVRNLQTEMDKMSSVQVFDGFKADVDGVGNEVKTIGDDWEDVTRQMTENHKNATKEVIEDLSDIERAVEKAFGSAGRGDYDVSIPPGLGLRHGGRIPGYGGGDGYNADTERGEYVLPKEAASYYDPAFLEGLRTMSYPKDQEASVRTVDPQTAKQSNKNNESYRTFSLDLPVPGPPVEVQATPSNIHLLENQFSEWEKYAS